MREKQLIAAWLGFSFGVLTMLITLAVVLSLTGCATGRPPADERPNAQLVAPAVALDSLALLPPYLVPAPLGSTPRQRRQWQRSQARNLARAGHLPRTVKIKRSSLAIGAGAVAITRPAAAVAAAPQAVATDNRQAGNKGNAAAGAGAVATASTTRGLSYWWVLLVAVLAVAWWQRRRIIAWALP